MATPRRSIPPLSASRPNTAQMLVSPRSVLDVKDIVKKLDTPGTPSTTKSHEKLRIRLAKELPNYLNITISGIGDTGLTALCKCLHQRAFPRLHTIEVLYNRITSKSLWDFARAVGTGSLTNLQVLNFTMNLTFMDAGAKALAKAMESGKLKKLEQLILMNDSFGEQGLTVIADALAGGHVPNLKVLRLGNNSPDSFIFHSQGAKALAAAVRSSNLPNLENLLFRGVSGEEGIIQLLKALESSKVGAFVELDLRYCDLGVRGAKALSDTLKSPQFASLIRLDLQNNVSFGDDGVVALSSAFSSDNLKNLEVLCLDNVSMSEKGLMELASLLQAGHLGKLQELLAGASEYTETSAKALVRAYEENKSLVARVTVDWPSTSWGNQVEVLREKNVLYTSVGHLALEQTAEKLKPVTPIEDLISSQTAEYETSIAEQNRELTSSKAAEKENPSPDQNGDLHHPQTTEKELTAEEQSGDLTKH